MPYAELGEDAKRFARSCAKQVSTINEAPVVYWDTRRGREEACQRLDDTRSALIAAEAVVAAAKAALIIMKDHHGACNVV